MLIFQILSLSNYAYLCGSLYMQAYELIISV